jgi:hypothetical protein
MTTVVELADPTALLDHIRKLAEPWPTFPAVTRETVHIHPYGYDPRIGWDTHMVTLDGYGVLGFTNGAWGNESMDKSPVERLVQRDIIDTPEMRADPALPVYVAIMARIESLMRLDPEKDTTQGVELLALVDLAEVYERRWFPEFCRQHEPREHS